jgi:hypothetical protein
VYRRTETCARSQIACSGAPERTTGAYSLEEDKRLWEMRTLPAEESAAALGRGIKGVTARLERLSDPRSEGHARLFGVTLAEQTASPLRPAREVAQRILWDSNLDPSDFIVGYRDRFRATIAEVAFTEPNTSVQGPERLHVLALPEHRIEYFLFRKRLVWSKALRRDLVFGSGVPPADGGPLKIQRVIEGYASWAAARAERSRQAREAALPYLDAKIDALDALAALLRGAREGEVSVGTFVDAVAGASFFRLDDEAASPGAEARVAALVGLVELLPEQDGELKAQLVEAVRRRVAVAAQAGSA